MSQNPSPRSLPNHGATIQCTFLGDKILMVAMNRPKYLNAMTDEMEQDLERLLDYAEQEPSVWVIVITSTHTAQSPKAFCSGQDLREWFKNKNENQRERLLRNSNGFGSISRRRLRKPIIAAVDGICLGGGLELVLNCDMVIATESSTFGFPEVTKGVFVAQGGISRLLYHSGRTLAAELLFLGRSINAIEARDRFRFVNQVVSTTEDLLPAVLKISNQIASNSPAAVQLTKLALIDTLEHVHESFLKEDQLVRLKKMETQIGRGIDQSTVATLLRKEFEDWASGPDMKEGLESFLQKRKPRWKDPENKEFGTNKL